jgi:hypothetical protein
MVFFQAIQAIYQLNIAFFIEVFMNNLLWVFMFYVMIHFLFEGKRTVYWFVLFSFTLWALLAWESLTGFVFSAASFLLLFYLSKFALLGFVEDIPSLKRHIVLISSIAGYSVVVFYTFFLQ